MEINLHQLTVICIWAVLLILAYKIKKPFFRISVFFIAVILFFFNPIKFEEKGGESLERNISRFDKIPEKIEVKMMGYQERSTLEHKKLQDESLEISDEI